MPFVPKTLDYDLSPYTGLTYDSWMEAGKYILDGVFENIKDFNDPVIMPRKETEISYPHLKDSKEAQHAQELAEIFEGLTRTFFIAAPVISNEPDFTSNGYKLSEYYKNQILRCCKTDDPICVGTYEQLQEIVGREDPFRTFQQTVETCALVICLWISKEQIWDQYTKEEKDIIADFLSGYAHTNTVPQNWRLFNMLDMAFLKMEGYEIDEEIMLDHAQAIMNYYVGDGWYRDGHSFDYYSCWAFNVYAPLWNLWYGYEHAPQIAKKFEEYSNKLMESYADFFDEDGFTNMWGRSNIYRNAATSAFDGNLFLKNSKMDPGLARRISSGSLMQFLSRDDVLYKGVPTLGFYGQFSPLVQGYSCAESPFWFGKAFLCLHLPKDHPFWTAKENNGSWDKLKEKEVKETCLNGPALCFSNHKANSSTILRTGKVVKDKGDLHGMWNYSKMCFNSKYPWEATPKFKDSKGNVLVDKEDASYKDKISQLDISEIESQQYVLKDITTNNILLPNVTFWAGEKDGILYRRQFFDYNLQTECHWIQAINLSDFTVPYGIIRVDNHRLHRRPVSFTLGSYGFPDNGTEIIKKENGKAKAIILKGKDYTGKEKQMAMTIYDGWKDIDIVHSIGSNPDSEKSIIIYAKTDFKKQYGGAEAYVMISQIITKESLDDFSDDDLFPIKEISYEDDLNTGMYGNITVSLKNGSTKTVDFEGIEGRMML